MSELMISEQAPARRPAPLRSFTRAQKAAAVLLAVGPDAASKVLKHLAEHEVEQVALEVATLGELDPADLNPILEEFHGEAMAHAHLVSGGEGYARDMLRRVFGPDGDDVVDRVLATVQTAPFQFLRQHEPRELVQQLRDEHPQTIALILAHLPTKFASKLLSDLEEDTQRQVSLRIALLDRTSPEVIERVEEALRERMGAVARQRALECGGVRDLAAMLNNADRHTEQSILNNLEEHDPELAEQVRELMFVFEDIVILDDRAVQEVLRQVDMKVVARALKGTADDVRDIVTRNLSERAREMLLEELELLGPMRVREVEEAQTEVVRRIRGLEEEGAIVINRGGEGEFID